MDEPYYTDEMRQFVESLDNAFNFPVDIMILNDADGPYLALLFKQSDHAKWGEDRLTLEGIATYLVDLRNGLKERGARVTFLVGGD